MSQPAGPRPPLWSRNFILLSLSNALLFAGFHLLLPTLPLFVAAYGGSPAEIGLIVGGFTFSAIGIRPFTSAGIGRWGRSRFLRLGLAVCILSMAGYYFTGQAATTLAVRLAHGLGFGIASTLYAAIAADLIPAGRRGEGMGYFGLGTTFMMALAPLTGLWLYEVFRPEGLFAAGVAVQGLALAILWAIPSGENADGPAAGAPLAPFPWRRVLVPCGLSLLLGICMGGVMSFIVLLAKERQFADPGMFFFTSTAFVFLMRTFSGRVYDRLGAPWVIAPAGGLLFISMVALATGGVSLLAAAAFYGAALGALFPAMQTWMLQLAPHGRQVTASARYYNAVDIGVGGGSIVLGLLAEGQSYAVIYLATSVISLAFLGGYVLYVLLRPPGHGAAGK
jgi:MFS family permease